MILQSCNTATSPPRSCTPNSHYFTTQNPYSIPPFFRSVILYDSMFSASVSFPNKKDMDAFIAAFTRAKASLSPLSAAAAGGLPVSEGAAGGANAAM